jgi:hypothetical protein
LNVEAAETVEVPPVAPGVVTVMGTAPALAIWAAEIGTVNCVVLLKVTVRGVVLHFAVVAPDTKPVPFTVSVNAAPPAATELGLRLVTVGTAARAVADARNNAVKATRTDKQ